MASAWGKGWGVSWGSAWGAIQAAPPPRLQMGGGGSAVGGGPDAQVVMSEFIRRFTSARSHPVRFRRKTKGRRERELLALLLR